MADTRERHGGRPRHGGAGPWPDAGPGRARRRAGLLAAAALVGTGVLVVAAIGAGRIGYALGHAVGTNATTVRQSAGDALDFWTPARMHGAGVADGSRPTAAAVATAGGPQAPASPGTGFDTPPPVEQSVAEPRPYADREVRIEGRVFAKSGPNTTVSCSGTVVRSPGADMVWTAAHCVHGGKGHGFYSDIVFVPAYDSGGTASDAAALAPFGTWTVRAVSINPAWAQTGDPSHSKADYAALVVAPRADGTRLADAVGEAAPIRFNAPRHVEVSAYGYPAEPPYTGNDLYRCDSPSQDYPEFDEPGPDLVWIGCTMSPGASGGGWFTTIGGTAYLVSNFSMYSADSRHYGPYLDAAAQSVYAAAVADGG